ncbi:MAG: TonB-dependent receptor, partial [Gammaproteobacteria bacterium]|nr:TonB-dependent receptor [Gammaproteobacteria bacterium]
FSFADGKGEAKIGTKIEHNDYSGLEWQPSASLLWNFSDTRAIWTAISRTVRTPSRAESNATYNARAFFNPDIPPAGMVTVMRVTANDEIDSEKVMSYELGYRTRPTETIFIDIAAFYSHYEGLTGGIVSGTPFPEPMPSPSHMVMSVTVDNSSDGESYGFELSGNWSVVDWWRLNVGYTWFHLNLLNDDDVLFQRPGFGEDQQAQNKVTMSSYMDLPANFELNATLSYIDKLLDMDIDSYVNCDLNLAWHPSHALTVT